MAFSQADLDAINATIASGTLRVRWPDGSMVDYQSTSDLLKARAAIAADLSATAAGRAGSIRHSVVEA